MNFTRQDKVAKLLQKKLALYFQKEITFKSNSTIVSVTNVRISPDFSFSKVFISIFPPESSLTILKEINENKKSIRYSIARETKNILKKIPEFHFMLDDSIDYFNKIENLLKEKHKNPLDL